MNETAIPALRGFTARSPKGNCFPGGNTLVHLKTFRLVISGLPDVDFSLPRFYARHSCVKVSGVTTGGGWWRFSRVKLNGRRAENRRHQIDYEINSSH
jgi:hypothetical protein